MLNSTCAELGLKAICVMDTSWMPESCVLLPSSTLLLGPGDPEVLELWSLPRTSSQVALK